MRRMHKHKEPVVYMCISMIDDSLYFGKANDFEYRVWKHSLARGDCPVLHNHIRKYGFDNFIFTIVEYCDTVEQSAQRERYYIALYKTNMKRYGEAYGGLNMTDGGDGSDGFVHTNESKQKISNAAKGRSSKFKGKTHTAQSRMNMSIGQKAYAAREDYIAPNQGKHLKPETKTKLSALRKGKVNTYLLKLDNIKADHIRRLYMTGNYSAKNLGKECGVSTQTISRILSGYSYLSVDAQSKLLIDACRDFFGQQKMTVYERKKGKPLLAKRKLTQEDIVEIRRLYACGNTSYAKLSKLYNVNATTIAKIINNKSAYDKATP